MALTLQCLKSRPVALSGQSGFTLVEVALALAVLGMFIGAVMSVAPQQDDDFAVRITHERQKRIAVALSDHANKHGYLPCAANTWENPEMFGASGPIGTFGMMAECASFTGVVPFRNLGLSIHDAYDGYGNLMTYAVNPFAVLIYPNDNFGTPSDNYGTGIPPSQPHFMTDDNILTRCAIADFWVRDDGTGTGTYRNVNPDKARFCCRPGSEFYESHYPSNFIPAFIKNAEGVVRWHSTGNPVEHPQQHSSVLGWVKIDATGVLVDNESISYYAYSIRSHGKNGYGALIYKGGGSGDRIMPAGTREIDAADPVNAYPDLHIGYYNPSRGDNYYDDIVLWRTQEQTIAETGLTSCALPQAIPY